jgi:hypothetical protein
MGTLSKGLSSYSKIPGFMPNLFEVSIFGEATNSYNEQYNIPFTEGGVMDYAKPTPSQIQKYYCSAYELPSPTLIAERNKLDKKAYIKKYSIPEIVSITWQENTYLDVWKYHQEWVRRFYNREKDVYVCGSSGKKRNAHILIQQYAVTSKSIFDPYAEEDLMETYTIRLGGLIPQSTPVLRGDWNQDASNTTGLVIKYFVDYISITKNDKDFIGAQ